MGFATLKNVTTADDWTPAATQRLPGTERIVLQVANAAVLYQLDQDVHGKGSWGEERFLAPSIGSLDRRCSGIRFRSALEGKPAQVSCELLDVAELSGGADALSPFEAIVAASGGIGVGAVSVPVGGLTLWAGSAEPAGWLVCDGRDVSRTTYAALFAAIGVAYGAGDGATTFNIPDFRGRVPVGLGPHVSVDALGDNEGVTAADRRPQHRHTPHAHTITSRDGAGAGALFAQGNNVAQAPATSSVDGGSGVATDPLDAPAYLVVHVLIATGV